MTVIKLPVGRRRVLLFDGNDQSVASAAPALAGIGIDLVRLMVAYLPDPMECFHRRVASGGAENKPRRRNLWVKLPGFNGAID